MKPSLLISDLHLDPEQPGPIALFEHFCRAQAGASALYVLGDLFEMWIGDDCDDAASRAVIRSLAALADTGTEVLLMHGNRDFLMADRLAAACGARLLADPSVIQFGATRCVLSHGDALCTADTAYMALRERLRAPEFARDMLARPLSERAGIGAAMRARSRTENANKAEQIMDVTQIEVDALLASHDATVLIHGHTHRPGMHHWQHEGQHRTRVVLGAWAETARYAVLDPVAGEVELLEFSGASAPSAGRPL